MKCGTCCYMETIKCPYLRPETDTDATNCGFFSSELSDYDRLDMKRESKVA